MKSTRLIAFLVSVLMLLPACGLTSFDERVEPVEGEDLVIAFSEVPASYSPVDYNAVTRKYINNVYEPLVRFDRDYDLSSSLALSWGRIDDYTWDFKLRKGVFFHDGREFNADDAVFSLDYAREDESSGLVSLLSGIVSVEKTGDLRFQIRTEEPDPVLVNRLANVYVFPRYYTDFDVPIGTGAYFVSEFGSDYLGLSRFDAYWGSTPYFETVYLKYVPDADERLAGVLAGEIDILGNVPPQYIDSFDDDIFKIEQMPSLEVSFLMMNVDGVLEDKKLREAIWNAVSDDYAESLGGGFLTPANQYAASGIAGHMGGYPWRKQNNEAAWAFRQEHDGDVLLQLDFPEGLEVLGEGIVADLLGIDIVVDANYLPLDEYENYVLGGNSDLYFFGWKYDLADSGDFFESVVHTRDGEYGLYNGINFSDAGLDLLIEDISTKMADGSRQDFLGNATKQLDDFYVILPLFESTSTYVFQSGIKWDLRLDGQLLASEMFEIVVE